MEVRKNALAEMTVEQAIDANGLGWEVEKVPLFCSDDLSNASGGYAIRNVETKKVLGITGKNYVQLQNRVAFKHFQPFLDQGFAELSTAGSFKHGSVVYMQARIKADPIKIVEGDYIDRYILMSHGHNGKMSVRFGFTPIRIVCENVLAIAHNHRGAELIRVKHSNQTDLALGDLQRAMTNANMRFEASAEQYKALARKSINQNDLNKYIKRLFKLDNLTGVEQKQKDSKIIEKINNLFENGKGNDLQLVKNTWWAAYNGVTDYFTHSIGFDQNRRDESLLLGQNNRINARALDMALEMAF